MRIPTHPGLFIKKFFSPALYIEPLVTLVYDNINELARSNPHMQDSGSPMVMDFLTFGSMPEIVRCRTLIGLYKQTCLPDFLLTAFEYYGIPSYRCTKEDLRNDMKAFNQAVDPFDLLTKRDFSDAVISDAEHFFVGAVTGSLFCSPAIGFFLGELSTAAWDGIAALIYLIKADLSFIKNGFEGDTDVMQSLRLSWHNAHQFAVPDQAGIFYGMAMAHNFLYQKFPASR